VAKDARKKARNDVEAPVRQALQQRSFLKKSFLIVDDLVRFLQSEGVPLPPKHLQTKPKLIELTQNTLGL